MNRDIHNEPFDDGTKAKLEIFKKYLKEWLPVFFQKKEIYYPNINIFDFFSGPGADLEGVKGTPLIILDELKAHIDKIEEKKLNVHLYFNEFNYNKYQELKTRLHPICQNIPLNYKIDKLDFKKAFDKKLSTMGLKGSANLLFLDQTGIKQITPEVFTQIVNLKQTDFLFFISSSTIKRFTEHPNIEQHIKLNKADVNKTPYHQIHRLILDYYRTLLPNGRDYYLSSFSLKKNSGIYGLIFGSGHVLGIEKFLKTCWEIDPERGEANFDIDDDNISPGQILLFTGNVKRPKKVDIFEQDLKNNILAHKLKNDRDIYLFTLRNGFLPSHAKKVLAELIADRRLVKANFNLTSKICKKGTLLTEIKLK